jgi:hypothetical protein
MIFSFDSPEEYLKFVKIADKHRYVCYRSSLHSFLMLRPIKSSKHLDTAIYNGIESKDLDKHIDEKYTVITVSEITFLRE